MFRISNARLLLQTLQLDLNDKIIKVDVTDSIAASQRDAMVVFVNHQAGITYPSLRQIIDSPNVPCL